MNDTCWPAALVNFEPSTATFLDDVLSGLEASPRRLPCKYFYDERGSRLFDEICHLDEYYPTRTELSIMRKHAGEMADRIGPGAMLVEFGSGSSIKTRVLLRRLVSPAAYVPVDISREHLERSAARLSRAFPQVEVLPVCADFTEDFVLPEPERTPTHTAVYFPGSTIGNFEPDAARAMLEQIAALAGAGGGLLIGVDLDKDTATLEAAYDDARGVTAQFNLNLLRRINRELDGTFNLHKFAHRAVYNRAAGRIEISLVSRCRQVAEVAGRPFEFAPGDAILTEYSHKYTIDGFADMAAGAGLALRRSWTDEHQRFAVLHFARHD